MTPITVTIAGAAQATGLSQDAIRQAVNEARLPAKRYGGKEGKGGRIIIRWTDLQEWVNALEDVNA